VRLFGIERENPVSQRLIGRDQHCDLLQAQHLAGGQTMTPIRRPQLAVFAANHDQRVEKRLSFIDLLRQTFGMGGR